MSGHEELGRSFEELEAEAELGACIYCGRRPPIMLSDEGEPLPYDGAPICRPMCPPRRSSARPGLPAETYTEHETHEIDELSHEAYEEILPTLGARQRAVYEALEELGGEASAEQLADALGWDKYHVMPRITELRKQGLIGKTGARRETRSGKRENVWAVRN